MTRRGRPTRRSSLKDTRRQLLLFVEGRRTEPGYLQHYHRLHRDRVMVTLDKLPGTPAQLVERAIAAKRAEER